MENLGDMIYIFGGGGYLTIGVDFLLKYRDKKEVFYFVFAILFNGAGLVSLLYPFLPNY